MAGDGALAPSIRRPCTRKLRNCIPVPPRITKPGPFGAKMFMSLMSISFVLSPDPATLLNSTAGTPAAPAVKMRTLSNTLSRI